MHVLPLNRLYLHKERLDMGLFDNVSAAVSRGTAAAERTTRKVKLQTQLNEVNKRRQGLAAQLGASLYEVTKDNPEFRSGRESLYDNIAACDAERDALQEQISQVESEASASAAAAHSFNCVKCGARMSEADQFCSGCGAPAAEARPPMPTYAQPVESVPYDGPTCPSCNAPIVEGDAFCMQCGASLAPQPAGQPAEA